MVIAGPGKGLTLVIGVPACIQSPAMSQLQEGGFTLHGLPDLPYHSQAGSCGARDLWEEGLGWAPYCSKMASRRTCPCSGRHRHMSG